MTFPAYTTLSEWRARPLTGEEIEDLAKRSGVRRVAVENFLGSLYLLISFQEQMANLRADARAYGWSVKTVNAIAYGIRLAYGPHAA